NAAQQDAVIRVQLTDKRKLTSQQYAAQLRKVLSADRRFAGNLDLAFDTGGMVSAALNFGTSSPIDIAVEGGRPDQAMKLAQEIRRRVKPLTGAADVRVVQRLDAPYLILDVKREDAAAVGLTARDVILQVVAAMNSSTSINRNFWIDAKTGNQYFVAVHYPEDPDRTLEALQNVFAVTGGDKQSIKLSSLVTIKPSSGAVEVSHASLRRVTNILVNTEGRDIGSLADEIHKVLGQLDAEGKVPKGMKVELRGEYARMKESFRSLGGGLLLAALLVYLLM